MLHQQQLEQFFRKVVWSKQALLFTLWLIVGFVTKSMRQYAKFIAQQVKARCVPELGDGNSELC
jgi:hypothetical protein